MPIDKLPEDLRLLADPAQEVLIQRPSAFTQLAPVPLCQLGVESIAAGEAYLPGTRSYSD